MEPDLNDPWLLDPTLFPAQVLLADYSISCESAKYNGIRMAYAVFMVFIYPVGIPLLYFVQLYRHRHTINPDLERLPGETDEELQLRKINVREADDSHHHIVFLYDEYGVLRRSTSGVPRRASRQRRPSARVGAACHIDPLTRMFLDEATTAGTSRVACSTSSSTFCGS